MRTKFVIGCIFLLVILGIDVVGQTVDTAWVKYVNWPGTSLAQSRAIALDRAGNVYITGNNIWSGIYDDYTTYKYTPAGDSVWVSYYNGPINSVDIPYAMAIDTSLYPLRALYVTGLSLGGSVEDYATISYKPNGDTNWIRRYNGPANGSDYAKAIACRGGFVYVTGTSLGVGSSSDFATIKYDSLGNVNWTSRSMDRAMALIWQWQLMLIQPILSM